MLTGGLVFSSYLSGVHQCWAACFPPSELAGCSLVCIMLRKQGCGVRTFLTATPFGLTDHLDAKEAGELSTLFDVGGIFGESITPGSVRTNSGT